jgi:hypothetical protein
LRIVASFSCFLPDMGCDCTAAVLEMMPHAHNHHDHANGAANFGAAFAIATALILVMAQVGYDLAANSAALLVLRRRAWPRH